MKRLYGGHVLDQPGSVWRDAFAAGRCADQLGADAVRLGADPPDFELRFGSRVEPYEFVEVQAPGRRRGDELKAERRKSAAERERTLRIPQEEWTRSTVVLDALRKAVVSKSSKAYAPRTNLLIYLNVWPVAGTVALEAGLRAAILPACVAFNAVWVLQGDNLMRVEEGRGEQISHP